MKTCSLLFRGEPGAQGSPDSFLPALATPRPLLPITAWAGAQPALGNSRLLFPLHCSTVCDSIRGVKPQRSPLNAGSTEQAGSPN